VASTQIETALAEDDRKRIDRLCNVIERKHAIDEFEGWLQKRYAALVFTHNGSGLGIHKRLADEVKEILERLHEAKATI
jgi:TFIIF-interacting CTD phosphatase-like protein